MSCRRLIIVLPVPWERLCERMSHCTAPSASSTAGTPLPHAHLVSGTNSTQQTVCAERITVPAARIGRDGTLHRSAHQAGPCGIVDMQDVSVQQPTSAADFERTWRRVRQSHTAAHRYLMQLPPQLVQRIFRVELKSTVLNGILDALGHSPDLLDSTCVDAGKQAAQSACINADAEGAAQVQSAQQARDRVPQQADSEQRCVACQTAGILQALTCCGRFKLVSRLVPAATTQRLQDLLVKLQQHVSAQDGTSLPVEHLAQAYGLGINCV